MTILYEGFRGNDPSIILGIILSIIGLGLIVLFILYVRDGESDGAVATFMMLLIVIAALLTNFTSHRYPIVRAILDDTASFKGTYKNYELIDVEGDIYTFRVKENEGE